MKHSKLLLTTALFAGLIGTAQAQESGDVRHAKEFLAACDADKDGTVSKKEFVAQMEKMFDKMDAKKAGKLDVKQVESLLAQLKKSGA